MAIKKGPDSVDDGEASCHDVRQAERLAKRTPQNCSSQIKWSLQTRGPD
jgi:hypothetical protein